MEKGFPWCTALLRSSTKICLLSTLQNLMKFKMVVLQNLQGLQSKICNPKLAIQDGGSQIGSHKILQDPKDSALQCTLCVSRGASLYKIFDDKATFHVWRDRHWLGDQKSTRSPGTTFGGHGRLLTPPDSLTSWVQHRDLCPLEEPVVPPML